MRSKIQNVKIEFCLTCVMLVLFSYSCQTTENESEKMSETATENNYTKKEIEEEILTLNEQFEQSMLETDTVFLEKIFTDDFLFTHGDGWIKEGGYLAYEDKTQTLNAVKKKPFQYRKTAKSEVELHDDIAIVNGVYNSGMNIQGEDMNINITYVRVYANRPEGWRLLSHKTVQLIATPITT